MTSAAFTINTTPVPAAVSVAYGGAVALALLSTTGATTITWRVAGSSNSSYTNPTITPSGVPMGATASLTQIADPVTGLGASFLIECTVTDSNGDTYRQTGIVGTANVAGIIPIACNEMAARDATHGWVEVLNQALNCVQSVVAWGYVAHDFGSIASDGTADFVTTVGAGILSTDRVEVWVPTPYATLRFEGFYHSATEIQIVAFNTSAAAVDPSSLNFYYRVTR